MPDDAPPGGDQPPPAPTGAAPAGERPPRPPRAPRAPQAAVNEAAFTGTSVFVKNLTWTTTSDDLVASFKRFGPVTGANVQVRKDGRSRGWGTVQFASKDGADKAVAAMLDGKSEIDGRAVEVAIDRKA